VPTIVVEVMPKAELLDPQGKAVAGALARLGKTRFTGVRIGKRFEIELDGPADDSALVEARELAETLFSNSVIEDVVGIRYKAIEIDTSSTEVAGETH
jgi:phosphoribosylformylglycinamidine synthase subunit PurS